MRSIFMISLLSNFLESEKVRSTKCAQILNIKHLWNLKGKHNFSLFKKLTKREFKLDTFVYNVKCVNTKGMRFFILISYVIF